MDPYLDPFLHRLLGANICKGSRNEPERPPLCPQALKSGSQKTIGLRCLSPGNEWFEKGNTNENEQDIDKSDGKDETERKKLPRKEKETI